MLCVAAAGMYTICQPMLLSGCCLDACACRVRLPINLETDRGVILGEGKPENQNHAVIFCHT